MTKSIVMITMMFLLMVPMVTIANTSLNDAVKEARNSGQVLSAKTRDGVHEVRVMTPQGTIRTLRKSSGQTTTQPNTGVYQRPEVYNSPYFQRPSEYQAEPQKEPQSNHQETRQRLNPIQSRRSGAARSNRQPPSRAVQPSRQPLDRLPEPNDPD